MRWLIVTIESQTLACIPESAAIFARISDGRGSEIPALIPVAGIAIPLAGRPGLVARWADNPEPLTGMPEFGTPVSSIHTTQTRILR